MSFRLIESFLFSKDRKLSSKSFLVASRKAHVSFHFWLISKAINFFAVYSVRKTNMYILRNVHIWLLAGLKCIISIADTRRLEVCGHGGGSIAALRVLHRDNGWHNWHPDGCAAYFRICGPRPDHRRLPRKIGAQQDYKVLLSQVSQVPNMWMLIWHHYCMSLEDNAALQSSLIDDDQWIYADFSTTQSLLSSANLHQS